MGMKLSRYTTPNGSVWVASTEHGPFAGVTRAEASARAAQTPMYETEFPARYKPLSGTPMLVVGANNWLRQRVPFYMLQEYDLHLFFMPSLEGTYRTGLVLFARVGTSAPIYIYASGESIEVALTETVLGAVAEASIRQTSEAVPQAHPKMLVWLTHWVYRSRKISLKEVLNLGDTK